MTPHEALHALRACDQRNMGRANEYGTGDASLEKITGIESVARTVRSWNPHIIPGPLQTMAYAAGAIRTALPSLDAGVVQQRACDRVERARSFLERWKDGSDLGYAWFILGESAICDPTRHEGAHLGQLEHLLDLAETHGKIVIQILMDHVATPGRFGQFSVYETLGGPRVGYLETLIGGWYTTRSEDVARMYNAFSHITGLALTPTDSFELIKEQMEWWQQHPTTAEFRSELQATPGPGTV